MAPPRAPDNTAPDYKNIPHSHRLPVTHRDVVRVFNKLSRQALILLAQQWLAKKNREFCRPYFASDQDAEEENEVQAWEPAHSYEQLEEDYKLMAARKGGRKEVMDRILEGDWRSGISMYQLATAEVQYLLEHRSALRWNAKRMARVPANNTKNAKVMEVTNDTEHLPRFQAQTFMMNLAKEMTPLMKAHYFMTRLKTLPITILRVYVHDSPYSSEASLAADPGPSNGSARAVFFIWPNGSPFVFVSLNTQLGQVVGSEGRHLRDIMVQAIPKAFSRPSARYQLLQTSFTARSLDALLAYRGAGKTNAAAGGWSIFADNSFSQNALDFITTGRTDISQKGEKSGPGRPKRVSDADADVNPEAKRRKEIAQGRFGNSARPDDGHRLDRFEIRIDDAFPSMQNVSEEQETEGAPVQASKKKGRRSLLDRTAEDITEIQEDGEDRWVPDVRITFQGSHVFAGIRELVEEGIVDGEKMPGWMTGEASVTAGAVRHGRIRTKEQF